MLTNDDIKKIINAHREVFATKQDFEDLKEEMRLDFSNLMKSIDAYAQKADAYFQEMIALAHKVDRLEKWIHQIAEKTGIKLEYF